MWPLVKLDVRRIWAPNPRTSCDATRLVLMVVGVPEISRALDEMEDDHEKTD